MERALRAFSAVLCIFYCGSVARADDFGPAGDVRQVRGQANVLLTHSARVLGTDPKKIIVRNTVVVKDAALLDWQIGANSGLMGLIRKYDRWWDALDYKLEPDGWIPLAAFPLPPYCTTLPQAPNDKLLVNLGMPADLVSSTAQYMPNFLSAVVRNKPSKIGPFKPPVLIDRFCPNGAGMPLDADGGSLSALRDQTSGYDITLDYARNDAATGSRFRALYARAPTDAEMLPFPTPWNFSANSVIFSEITIDSPKPVSFKAGSKLTVWFPFVLDDTLRYNMTIAYTDPMVGPLYAKPFDNTLQYTLPAFSAQPGKILKLEIDALR